MRRGIDRVRNGAAESAVSDRIKIVSSRRTGSPSVRILALGEFLPIEDAAVHACLGADWSGSVEPQLRDGWFAPAIVYRRDGWPNVVLLGDDDKREIRVETVS